MLILTVYLILILLSTFLFGDTSTSINPINGVNNNEAKKYPQNPHRLEAPTNPIIKLNIITIGTLTSINFCLKIKVLFYKKLKQIENVHICLLQCYLLKYSKKKGFALMQIPFFL